MRARQSIKGDLMGVSVDGNFIACEIDAEMMLDKQLIPVLSRDDGRYNEYVPGKRDWQVTVNMGLLLDEAAQDAKSLYKAWDEDLDIIVQFRTRLAAHRFLIFEGKGLVRSLGMQVPRGSRSTATAIIQGNGALNMDWEEFMFIINAQPFDADKPYIVDTSKWILK